MVQAGHIVRNNVISDNGLCGIAGWSAKNCRIYNNLLERNNRLSFSKVEADWEEWAAIKLHATDAVIAGNTIRDNEAAGIWIDNDYHMSRITGNLLIGNRLAGIKMELSQKRPASFSLRFTCSRRKVYRRVPDHACCSKRDITRSTWRCSCKSAGRPARESRP